jgi:aldehyde dehydrogenase (NAD+)
VSGTVKDTRKTLLDAIEQQDFAAYDKAYYAFLSQFGRFNQFDSNAKPPHAVAFSNPIFGKESAYRIHQPSDAEGSQILGRSRAASGVMAKLSAGDRQALLKLLQDRIRVHASEIETTITADTGKPIDLAHDEMKKGDVWFEYAQLNAEGQLGKLQDRRAPLGAVQVIGAYNYPYALAIGGIVGGLAAGNGVIVTAPQKAPHWVLPFMDAADEAVAAFAKQKNLSEPEAKALRDGLVQFSAGVNKTITTQADLVHFVGSDKVGNAIKQSRGKKPTVLEMGGTNVVTVLASALDQQTPQHIAESIYSGFGPASGQRCTAPRVLCLQHGAEKVGEALGVLCERDQGAFQMGNPFAPGTKMGPLVDRDTYMQMNKMIDFAKSAGAKIYQKEINSNLVPESKQGYWMNPVVIDWSGVTNYHHSTIEYEIQRHEIFGPLLHIVQPVKNLDAAITLTNRLDQHKLAAAVYSANEADATRFHEETNVTSVMHNKPPKDMSPYQEHGHPGMDRIGGLRHFQLYSQAPNQQREHS